jgi:hypothetical protein
MRLVAHVQYVQRCHEQDAQRPHREPLTLPS